MMKNVRLVVATAVFMTAFAVVLLVNACHKEELPEKVFAATPYVLQIPRYFPTQLNIPDDNPLTQEGVRLGRYLFYDTRLCGYMGNDPDSMLSCASCHVLTQPLARYHPCPGPPVTLRDITGCI